MNSDRLVIGWHVGRFPNAIDPIHNPSVVCSHGNRRKTALRTCSSSGLEKVWSLRLVFLFCHQMTAGHGTRETKWLWSRHYVRSHLRPWFTESPVCAFDPWFLQIHLGSCFRQRLLLFFKRQSRMIFRFTDFRKSCLFSLGGLICLPLKKIVVSRCSNKNLSLSRNKTPEKHPDLTFSSVSTSPQVALYWLGCVMNLTHHLGLFEICVSKCTSFSSVVLPERVPIPSRSDPGPLGEPKFEDVSCMGELGTGVPDVSTTRDWDMRPKQKCVDTRNKKPTRNCETRGLILPQYSLGPR